MSAPLITREPKPTPSIPPSWAVVTCEQGCGESWTIDSAEESPALNLDQIEDILAPILLAHEQLVHRS